jgi:tRNA-2-methylthio-N6-dimethylallyladenosine synthase
MNEYDSQRMLGYLSLMGMNRVENPEDARVIIINTCSVREKPEEKTYSEIGRYRNLTRGGEGALLAVTGCVAQQREGEIIDRAPFVDLVIGTHQVNRIGELVERAGKGETHIIATEFESPPRVNEFPRTKKSVSAFITIMQGCNNFCSYCIVPFVRGRETSRRTDEILKEIHAATRAGAVEIYLLGQNVNSYLDPSTGLDFPRLLYRVAEMDSVKRIRFTTSHPKDLTPDLIDCFRKIEKLCPHIHLPLQSGSDRILRMMNRGYTGADYAEKVEALRHARDNLGITTDLIVGFPGETTDDFEQTIALMERIRFDGAYSFKYSPRPGTKASTYEDTVSDLEKARRLSILQGLQKKHTIEMNRKNVNEVVEVLATGPSTKNPGDITGRSLQNKVVNFTGMPQDIGSFIPVLITKAHNNSLWGKAIDKNSLRSL